MLKQSNINLLFQQKNETEDLQCEWWDAFFLRPSEGDQKNVRFDVVNEETIYHERITHYVQHPVPLKNEAVEQTAQMTIPFFLTEQEKKKLRRKKRIEKQKEK